VLLTAEIAPQLFVECIRKVHVGERWVERKSVGRALDTLLRREAGLRDLRQALTNRELSVSQGTIKSHLHHIYEKLGVKGRMGLLLLAQEKGLK
jgi:DNA-binding NarL/FixJ family response regulator